MADEKKKPEEDEVSDEQLEDVAGGVGTKEAVSEIRTPLPEPSPDTAADTDSISVELSKQRTFLRH